MNGQTSAEIIYESADKTKPFMGLQTWKNSPDGKVLKSDTVIAKNYLSVEDIKDLERVF
ncbi:MAG: RhuM family protein [Campylobacterota bacterium]|nr:RhuM family protein [Campylobacterota bacterium]